ncbi:MAG: hypothetical protein HC918_09685 [Oscillatoriales cyanobacterium SM2_1_8]|nr:hypothetical protein [Oscillatoriales cyanobacterium SM2_1_8]
MTDSTAESVAHFASLTWLDFTLPTIIRESLPDDVTSIASSRKFWFWGGRR